MSQQHLYTFHPYPSTNHKKKFDVYVPDAEGNIKKVSFGDSSYEDFTMHKDVKRKMSYQLRHQHDRINDPLSAGFWSFWLLWNKPSLQESYQDLLSRFHLTPELIR